LTDQSTLFSFIPSLYANRENRKLSPHYHKKRKQTDINNESHNNING